MAKQVKKEKKLTEEEKEQKKISPDSVSDEGTKDKEYESPDIMKEVAEFLDDDDDSEIIDASEEDKKTKVKEEKVEVEQKKKIAKQGPEDKEVEVEVEEEGVVEQKVEKKEPQKIQLSESAESALKPFEGDLPAKIDALVKKNNELTAKLQSYGTVQNFIKDFELDKLKPHEVSGMFKELREAADVINNPIALDSMEAVLTGNIPEALRGDEKTVKDYMPEDEPYDHEDAVTQKNSSSWNARVKWENERRQKERQTEEFLGKIKDKKLSATNLQRELEKGRKMLNEKMGELKAFVSDEFGEKGVEIFDDFVEEFKDFSVDSLKVQFAVFAKRREIKSKKFQKIEEQDGKSFAEAEIPGAIEEGEAILNPTDKDKDKDMSETFSDWDNEETIYK